MLAKDKAQGLLSQVFPLPMLLPLLFYSGDLFSLSWLLTMVSNQLVFPFFFRVCITSLLEAYGEARLHCYHIFFCDKVMFLIESCCSISCVSHIVTRPCYHFVIKSCYH